MKRIVLTMKKEKPLSFTEKKAIQRLLMCVFICRSART